MANLQAYRCDTETESSIWFKFLGNKNIDYYCYIYSYREKMSICIKEYIRAYFEKTNMVQISFAKPTWTIWFLFPDFRFKSFQTRTLSFLQLMPRLLVLKKMNLDSLLCLNVMELLARSRRHIWSLSDSNVIRTQNHLVRKRTHNHLAKLVLWVLFVKYEWIKSWRWNSVSEKLSNQKFMINTSKCFGKIG